MTARPAIAVVIPTLDEVDQVGAAVASAFDGCRGWLGPDGSGSPGENPSAPVNETGGSSVGVDDRTQASAPGTAVDDRTQALAPGTAVVDGEVRGPALDVVVVDGGSLDGTLDEARRAGARGIESAPGRGRQLDLGWRCTEADIVVFLHADSRLPAGWAAAVTHVMNDETVAGGAFRFGLDEPGGVWRILELGVAARVALLRLPYGDQALFVRRDVLAAAGGVPDVDILEDLDLVQTIKRAGRLAMLPITVTTSARRHGPGLVSTLAKHTLGLAGWWLGLDRAWLARKVRG